MDVFAELRALVRAGVESLAVEGRLPAGLDLGAVAVEPPRDPAHGDVATNAAMVLARPARMPARDLAAMLAERLLAAEGVAAAEIAGPGFLNLRLALTGVVGERSYVEPSVSMRLNGPEDAFVLGLSLPYVSGN